MPSPHDPDQPSSAGLALDDAGEARGNVASAQEEERVNESHRPTRFWLGLAALVFGLAMLAIVVFFFADLPAVLAAESIGAGIAALGIGILLLGNGWRAPSSPPASAEAATAAAEPPAPVEAASAVPEAAPTPEIGSAPEPPAEAAEPLIEQPQASAAAAPAPAPARKATRPKTGTPPPNGHSAAAEAPLAKPALTNLAQSYPRPPGGYSIAAEAEDLSQLLGDVAEQTVIVFATKGQRGSERRERMASKIDDFSQEMSSDPSYEPVVAYLRSISALLRAGKPIPATHPLVDPFDGLYGYVLTLILRKTGKIHD